MIEVQSEKNTGCFAPAPQQYNDHNLVQRICESYRYSTNTFGMSNDVGESQWSEINDLKRDSHNALISGGDAATAMLRDPGSNQLLLGFDSLYERYTTTLRQEPVRRVGEAAVIKSAIERLADALAVRRVANPEAPDNVPFRETNIETILFAIERRLGIELAFPNPYPDEFGVLTSRGVVSLRPILAIYQAYLLRNILSIVGSKSVVEIGAGLGRTVLYSMLLGVADYTIIDLPLANAAQAYFLGSLLGEGEIVLSGEQYLDRPVKIFTPDRMPDRRVGVVINVDSLTEMDNKIAREYIEYARGHAKAFVSINHEVNRFTVAELRADLLSEKPTIRSMHGMRSGYVEEITFLDSIY